MHFDGEGLWTLRFHKSGRGAPSTEGHRQREYLIRQELLAVAPLEKDETLALALAKGAFASLISEVRINMQNKWGMAVSESEIKKQWGELADELGIKRTHGKPRKPSKST